MTFNFTKLNRLVLEQNEWEGVHTAVESGATDIVIKEEFSIALMQLGEKPRSVE